MRRHIQKKKIEKEEWRNKSRTWKLSDNAKTKKTNDVKYLKTVRLAFHEERMLKGKRKRSLQRERTEAETEVFLQQINKEGKKR